MLRLIRQTSTGQKPHRWPAEFGFWPATKQKPLSAGNITSQQESIKYCTIQIREGRWKSQKQAWNSEPRGRTKLMARLLSHRKKTQIPNGGTAKVLAGFMPIWRTPSL